jgi:hypothetical protein
MIIRNLKSRRRLAAIAVFAIVALSAFGFAAANTVPDSKAGDGEGDITGYTVSSIHYVLDGTDPGLIDTVTFNLDSAPTAGSTVAIQFDAPTTVWACTTAGVAVTCDVSAGGTVTVLDVNTLRVVAAD